MVISKKLYKDTTEYQLKSSINDQLMLDISTENHTYSIFKSIHAEVISKFQYLQQLETEVQELHVDELEEDVQLLRSEVSALRMRTQEYTTNIQSNQLLINQYDEQTTLLRALFDEFQNQIKSYPNPKCADLSREMITEINSQIEALIKQMSDLCSTLDKDSIEQEYNRLNQINAKLKDEIAILTQFENDWSPINDLDNYLLDNEHFDSDIFDDTFNSFSDVQSCSKSPNGQSTEQFEHEINNSKSELSKRYFVTQDLHKQQLDFLISLKDALNRRTIDPEIAISQLQSQLSNGEYHPIAPITTPEIVMSNDIDQSIKALTDGFNDFSEELLCSLEDNSISNKLKHSVEGSFTFPDFQPPQINQPIQSSIPDQNLVHLSEQLTNLIQSSNHAQTLHDIRQRTGSLKEIFERSSNQNERDEKRLDSFSHDLELPQPIDPLPDNLKLLALKEVLKDKLPNGLIEKMDSENFNLHIEKIPSSEVSFNPTLTEGTEDAIHTISNSQSVSSETFIPAEEHAKALNEILNNLLKDDDLPPPHIFNPPVPRGVKILSVNPQPVIETITSILKPSQQEQPSLPEDISQFEQEIEALKIKLDNEAEAYEIEKRKDEELDRQIQEAQKDEKDKEQKWNSILDDAKNKKNLISETEKKIKELEGEIDAIENISEEDIEEKQAEFENKKEELKHLTKS